MGEITTITYYCDACKQDKKYREFVTSERKLINFYKPNVFKNVDLSISFIKSTSKYDDEKKCWIETEAHVCYPCFIEKIQNVLFEISKNQPSTG